MLISIELDRQGRSFSERILDISTIIPSNSVVLAYCSRDAEDFSRVIGKKLRYADDPRWLYGSDDMIVVKLGRYFLHKRWPELELFLKTRRNTMSIEIPDWR